jgi:N-acetylated-alpha-linked acidic dipeptidase
MIGNHRDAWVFGSVDPTSGTAALVEISRALSVLKQNHGWQPRRSILFLSWGSEEYGLLGSTEWVEEFNKKLNLNAVAYLNLDISVQGNYSYTAKASPLLHNIIYDVTRKIKLTENETVFDRWLKYGAGDNPSLP